MQTTKEIRTSEKHPLTEGKKYILSLLFNTLEKLVLIE